MPGHLIASLGSGGHLAALMLLALAGLATAASLVIAPPATPAAAARRIATGLSALFLLSPATRFGYFIYPIALYWWSALADRRGSRSVADVPLPDVTEAGGHLGLADAELKEDQRGAALDGYSPCPEHALGGAARLSGLLTSVPAGPRACVAAPRTGVR